MDLQVRWMIGGKYTIRLILILIILELIWLDMVNSDSPVIVDKYSPQALSKQINDILNNLSIEQVIILGYSMGRKSSVEFCYRSSK